jgi:hypothetical protein
MIPASRLARHLTLCAVATAMVGCSSDRKVETRVSGDDHFVSQAGGPTPIDVAAVEKAFWETKAADFQTWMGQFETRVNEIYDGGVVSLDARRTPQNLLAVSGYLDRNNQPGFQPDGDAKLFAIEQTDQARNDQMPYRVGGYDGQYYHRSHSLLDNPFVQMMVVGSLLNRPYYTPWDRIGSLRHHQTTYRQTPVYQQASQARKRLFGTTRSQRSFGSAPSGSGGSIRSWFGRHRSTAHTGASSGWGGSRRSTSASTPSRSWFGGLSSRSSTSSSASSSSSWGGRRSTGGFSWGGRSGSSGSSRRSWGSSRRRR